MRILVDSTVLIDYLRGREVVSRVDEVRRAGDVLCTTGINVEEIVRGLRPSEKAGAEKLFRGLTIISIGAPEGWQAGMWRRQFASRGVTLAQADCLIAAAALKARAVLATGNPRDFPMKELEVRHWPVNA